MAVRGTHIKICGIRDVDTAQCVAQAGADYLGLVFVEQSPRFVTVEKATELLRGLPGSVQPVGLFADHPLEEVLAIAQALNLSLVQLHGHESADYVRELAPRRVLKAMAFEASNLQETLRSWRLGVGPDNVLGLLLDSPRGGSGHVFDWEALAKFKREDGWHDLPPLFLAGGLTPDNVAQAVLTVRPLAVDVSSGVESQPGIKDPVRIRAFCEAVRAADTFDMEAGPT